MKLVLFLNAAVTAILFGLVARLAAEIAVIADDNAALVREVRAVNVEIVESLAK